MADDNRIDPWLSDAPGGNKDTKSVAATQSTDEAIGWQRNVIERLAFGALQEQRRARRWSIFFKALFFLYLVAIFIAYLPVDLVEEGMTGSRHTALVEIQGVIADDKEANADSIISGLRTAFESKGTKGVILRINSPGGSPVQSGYVYDEILRLRVKYPDIALYAVVTDICASGGYYIASAADQIYADKASIVGSIGVLMDGFGFVNTLEKLGVERRLITAGESKGFMDPFSPLKEEDKKHLQSLLESIHQQFINAVKKGRKDRLANDDKLFTGLMWTGEQSVKLGLVDGLGSSSYVARDLIGADKIVNFTQREPYFQRLVQRFGVAMANTLTSAFSGTIQ